MNEWTDGQMNEWMDEWLEGRMYSVWWRNE